MKTQLSAKTVCYALREMCIHSTEAELSKAFKLLFEADPKLAKIISQAIANFEGTQAVTPPSNATQVEYIDDYLDRLRGEETDFYK